MELQWGMYNLFSTETENTHTDALEKIIPILCSSACTFILKGVSQILIEISSPFSLLEGHFMGI